MKVRRRSPRQSIAVQEPRQGGDQPTKQARGGRRRLFVSDARPRSPPTPCGEQQQVDTPASISSHAAGRRRVPRRTPRRSPTLSPTEVSNPATSHSPQTPTSRRPRHLRREQRIESPVSISGDAVGRRRTPRRTPTLSPTKVSNPASSHSAQTPTSRHRRREQQVDSPVSTTTHATGRRRSPRLFPAAPAAEEFLSRQWSDVVGHGEKNRPRELSVPQRRPRHVLSKEVAYGRPIRELVMSGRVSVQNVFVHVSTLTCLEMNISNQTTLFFLTYR